VNIVTGALGKVARIKHSRDQVTILNGRELKRVPSIAIMSSRKNLREYWRRGTFVVQSVAFAQSALI